MQITEEEVMESNASSSMGKMREGSRMGRTGGGWAAL